MILTKGLDDVQIKKAITDLTWELYERFGERKKIINDRQVPIGMKIHLYLNNLRRIRLNKYDIKFLNDKYMKNN